LPGETGHETGHESLQPSGPRISNRLINARADMVTTQAAFGDAFRSPRGLVLANTVYECMSSSA
jgi:putative SOS response-associated peptidase YedK